MKKKRHFVFFDSAYQGFGGNGLDDDVYSLRSLSQNYMRVMLSQSFSKNFGLYGERTGCLSFICSDTNEKNVM